MLARKTIKAKVLELRKRKKQLLEQESDLLPALSLEISCGITAFSPPKALLVGP